MAYASLGLAGLLVSALRRAVTDPQVAEDARVAREGFTTLTGKLDTLASQLADNGSVDAEQRAELDGIRTELTDLATALTGPAEDPADNGVIGEVATVDPDADTSPSADAAVEATED